jgi:hypothetical protein
VDSVATLVQRIGRYFALVSWLPSLLLVLWSYALFATKGWHGAVNWNSVQSAATHWSVGKVIGIAAVAIVVAFLFHPLQFVITQILEGYWGKSTLAQEAMRIRVLHYRRLQRQAYRQGAEAEAALAEVSNAKFDERFARSRRKGDDPGTWTAELRAQKLTALLNSRAGDEIVPYLIRMNAAERAIDQYPHEPLRIMPTRLGNALRKFEAEAGSQYGLDAARVYPHLQFVAPPEHLAQVADAREEMDVSVRVCVSFLAATALTAAVLLRDGWSLLLALIPYLIAYLAYRGAVASARTYGVVVATLIDLDRFRLYDQLNVGRPSDTAEERANSIHLMRLISGDEFTNVAYHYIQDLAAPIDNA